MSSKNLTFLELLRISFNFLALLFGPIYYLCKGMWRKAITLTLLGYAAVFILGLADADEVRVQRVGTFALAGLFCARANVDFYKRRVLQDNGWW